MAWFALFLRRILRSTRDPVRTSGFGSYGAGHDQSFGSRTGHCAQASYKAALDALPQPIVVVDGRLRVTSANASALALAASGTGIRLTRCVSSGGMLLGVSHQADAMALDSLVRSAAHGVGPGGGLKIARSADEPDPPLVLIVRPVTSPGRLDDATGQGRGARTGHAMVLLQDLALKRASSPALLAQVFNLSKAEAEVASALAGGTTAGEVALHRNVEPATIRRQVRSILEKTGAARLRDLERILASLPVC